MDGEKVTRWIKDALRRPGVLLAASAAMVPAAFLWTGGDAEAETAPASMRYAVGTSGMLTAQDLARRIWGGEPCGGQVEVAWGTDEPLVNARSYWANPRSAYDDPALNTHCRIVFNSDLDFSWQKFCTVLVHEYGHLAGRPHVADGPDVMSPIYRAPLADCARTPDPAAPAPPSPAPAPAAVTEIIDAPVRRRSDRRTRARAAKVRSGSRARMVIDNVGALRQFSSSGRDHPPLKTCQCQRAIFWSV